MEDVRALNRLDEVTFSNFIKEKKVLKKEIDNENVAVSFELRMKKVKKDEDVRFRIDKNADEAVKIIKEFSDPNSTHPYKQKSIVDCVNKHFDSKVLNQHSFRAIKYYEDFESSKEMYYFHEQSSTKCYSQKAVDLIIKNIYSDPNYIETAIIEFKKEKNKK